MEVKSSLIKCKKCGVFTVNSDYCKQCGALISHKKKREIRAKREKEEAIAEAIEELNEQNFIDKLKIHPFLLVRIVGWLLYSVWFVVSIVGAGLAWAIAMIAAG